MTAVIDEASSALPRTGSPIVSIRDLDVYYGAFQAVGNVSFDVPKHQITALIGPSGCGKSTVLRCINRMNDLVPNARVTGTIAYHGVDINAPAVDPVEVRRHIGMVFQKPNPFPKSIYDNIAWGARINGFKGNYDELVERSLRQAAGPNSEVVDAAMVRRAHRLWTRPGNRSAFVDFLTTDQPDRSAGIPHIGVPTLVLRSAGMDGQHFSRDIAGSVDKVHPGGGHLLEEEDPGWVADAITEFLQSIPR